MSKDPYRSFSTRTTPQSQPIPNTDQVQNNAGGFAWLVDKWSRLDRFLVLGSEGGTYYVGQQKLTKDNADGVIACIKEDGPRVVLRVYHISASGRAPKNDPALFVLAMCAGLGDLATKRAALDALPKVARTGTHLFHFLNYVQQFRGWGRGLRDGVSKWYTDKSLNDTAYQLIKYRQRDGWTHRDVLRKAHPVPINKFQKYLYRWVTQGKMVKSLPELIHAYENAQAATDPKAIVDLIHSFNLPREAIPTQFLNDVGVWEALLEKMPLTALIRNLGKLTSLGILKPTGSSKAVTALTTEDHLHKARIHPLAVLVALKTYEQGHGVRGSLVWDPVREIVDALDEAFYLSFGNVVPTGKRTMLALDVSGSMDWEDVAGMTGISARVGSAAMALVTASVEPNYMTFAFAGGFIPLSISPRQRLDDVIRTVSGIRFDRTDCALPMLYALKKGLEIDTFVIYTDSETWCGSIHPIQALQQYREKTGIHAKLVVVGMTATGFSIADPNDAGMLDVVGFDTATPNIISEFAK